MLNPEIAMITNDWVDGALASRDRSIHMQIQAKQRTPAAQGVLRSGRAIFEYAEVANEELRVIAATLWTALLNALRAMPPVATADLKTDVQAAFDSLFLRRFKALEAALSNAFHSSAGERIQAVDAGVDVIRRTYEALSKRYSAEIALWAAAYGRSQMNSQPSSAQYIFMALLDQCKRERIRRPLSHRI